MAMKDMALTADELKKRYEDYPGVMSRLNDKTGAQYPHELTLPLTAPMLEKLGITEDKLPARGDMMHLFAMAKVLSVTKRDDEDGQGCSVCLQITHLGTEDEDRETEPDADADDPKARGDRWYGAKDEEQS